ncbi:superoxide dismutase family protein [Lentibacillus sp. CBA3610]|uniref:superoxide dismutase family protein n=1 Tax=Lentibacillus sp. CBA3610 TaxID=2518176 RepID=UPI001594FC34|nr:superoxide dismutase family protein [Lentibacillus sp. CBA3610]QKY69774.1 superoxide dismutase family protein [Lentibacillus sp. CBA3610]
MKKVLWVVLFMFFITACQETDQTSRTVDMYNSSGDMIGTVQLTEGDGGVDFKVELEGLDPGYHGIHVHEYPKCDQPDFTTAGSHFNPDGNEHGLMHPEGSHLGDLPNIEADPDGLVEAELMLPEATLMDGKKSLLDGEGTSLVIHEGQDDGVSQPGGESGARIVCGIIATDEKESAETPTDPTNFNEDQGE